jgi:hypothetical protein
MPVARLADDLDVVLQGENGTKAVAQHLMIVRQENSNAHAAPSLVFGVPAVMGATTTILVPASGAESI